MPRNLYLLLLTGLLFFAGCANRDYTRGQLSVCEVHDVPMVKTKVPVVYYGFYPRSKRSEAENAARATLFPNARYTVNFDRRGRKPKTASAYVCLECREAFQKWQLEYDAKK
jgi:hypothetical protein